MKFMVVLAYGLFRPHEIYYGEIHGYQLLYKGMNMSMKKSYTLLIIYEPQ